MDVFAKLTYLQCDVEKFSDEKFYKETESKISDLRKALREFDTFYLSAECRSLFQHRRNDLDDLLQCSQNLASYAHFHDEIPF